MKTIAFVIWMIGWPAYLDTYSFAAQYFGRRGTVPDDSDAGVGMLMLFIWVFIGVALWINQREPNKQ